MKSIKFLLIKKCFKNTKKEMHFNSLKKYIIGEKFINKQMDILMIIRKLNQLEHLKKILFNKTQLNVIKIFYKASIPLKEITNKDKEKELQEIFDSLNEIKKDSDYISSNIINMIEEI